MAEERDDHNRSEIAIIGMACRFPGASDVEQFWRNLCGGVESLVLLSDDELLQAGVDRSLLANPGFVRRASVLDGIEMFDPAFFGYTPLEAKLMDPQHRLFLECAWEVFEQAGHNPEKYPDPIGVFTGAKTNTYLFSLFSNRELFRSLDSFQIALGNDLGAMATRVSYKLNLRGPSYALHTACSTSLVAVHLACQSLLLGECRMAVAGGAAINVPQRRGYVAQKGGILSPDGSCRTFDGKAAGSNFGNGVGAVLLKRLEDALADGDPVRAVILGSAANNDGALKASYTAPGVEGQTNVLLDALACAGVDADSISYVEAHGTATELGDSIELLALTEAFRASTSRKGFCAIGSVKTNIGHLETAAGVAGLIKTALALESRQLPPSLHFEEPNPRIDFAGSPFQVVTRLQEWTSDGPLRAGVSSFGIGSTNAHVILEEPPAPITVTRSRPWQLLLLSARTESALETQTANLARRLRELAAADLPDSAFTLQVGRKEFAHRRTVVCRDIAGAVAALEGKDPERVFTKAQEISDRPVTFLFPGLGDHHVDMGLGLYRSERVFREALDRCAEILRPHLGLDLRQVIYPRGTDAEESGGGKLDLKRMLGRGDERDESSRRLDETWLAQPALFTVEYALARLWMEWGVPPQALIGHSLGEYVAACLAGVFSLEDALTLVARRASLIQELAAGAMLAVPLAEAEIAPLLAEHGLSLAAVNGPSASVAAGPVPAVAALESRLTGQGIACRLLPTTHAFHSAMMDGIAAPLTALVRSFARRPPAIPYVSNVTGTWITAEEATDPGYWARHLCQPVRFGDGIRTLLDGRGRILLEVGPGQGLSSFVKQHPDCDDEAAQLVLPSLRSPYGRQADLEFLLGTLGKLWLAGHSVDWQAFWQDERRRRVPLPTYPFERQRCWIDPVTDEQAPAGRRVTLDKQEDMADWFYQPVWNAAPLPVAAAPKKSLWLVLADPMGLGEALAAQLRAAGCPVVIAVAGAAFGELGLDFFALHPGRPADYDALLAAVVRRGAVAQVVHLWSMPPPAEGEPFESLQERGFYSLLFLAQALGRRGVAEPVRISVVSTQLHRVTGDEILVPEKATLLGPCRVIPQELTRVTCRSIDVTLPEEEGGLDRFSDLARTLLDELVAGGDEPVVAWRGNQRRIQSFERQRLAPLAGAPSRLRQRGVYLITGGLGGLGLTLAEHLARTVQAKLVLTGRSPFPPREDWDAWLESHGEAGDPVSRRIRQLLALEEAGGEVLALAADAADVERMREVMRATRERFGALHGVIHMAGTPGGGILQLKTREMAERILSPKVEGARALAVALHGETLDFLVLFSSIAAVLGEFGQADYCGANAFLDAFAQRRAGRDDPPTITVDWDIWREVGLAVHTEVPAHLRPWRQEMLDKALSPQEGVEAFDRILGGALGRVPQVIVSTQELHGRIELGKSFTGESFLAELEKLERSHAPAQPARRVLGTTLAATADGSLERRVAEVWQRVLGVDQVGLHDNFFDLGGNSLLGLQLVSELSRDLEMQIAPVTLFESPTVSALTRHLRPEPETAPSAAVDELAERRRRRRQGGGRPPIAIIGMTGRFPGARNVEELWENLACGVESVTFFSDEELAAAGIHPELSSDPRYVRAGSILQGIDLFDAGLFGYSPREAEVTDPQHRIFMECAWETLEKAGYDPATYPGAIGVFAGSNLSTYLLRLYGDPDVKASVNMLQAILGNDKDSLTTIVSYKLDLRGPSVAVQTFCSTSLVAVHMGCQSLRAGECDMALAGGIRVVVPDTQGYLYEQGGLAPSDGHSRSFDAKANGSVLGHGVGIVCLKRLDDALADGDPIQAVILGSAINNDGSLKAGYTAPSVAGQAEAVVAAFEDAGVEPDSISYVEAHGSATELGDPIEVTALTRAWRRWTEERQVCPIGSVKSNFGHLDRAAGVTGLIKTVLALEHGVIPPSINFDEPNPKIDFAGSPFFVNTELREWKSNGKPRRAGVNSLGMGGTNVHVIVQEAPQPEPSSPSRPWQLVLLSAKTETALEAATRNLAAHFDAHPALDLADAAFTLQVGRTALEHRRLVVCRDLADAAAVLAGSDPKRLLTAFRGEGERPVVFLFSGLGGQYTGMGRGLYQSEPTFRRVVDRCAELLLPHLGADLREILYPADAAGPAGEGDAQPEVDLRRMLRRAGTAEDAALRRLNETRFAHPALFVLEYGLARLFLEWGIRPAALMGYSLGEYVAACLAGVFSLEDALALIAERARRVEELPAGAMLAVSMPEEAVAALLSADLSLAAVNGPEQSVVAGPLAAVEALERDLAARGVACRRLQVSHAFHSPMMEPVARAWAERLGRMRLQAPSIPYISNVTGTWVTASEATDPAFWARHMCQAVRFSEGIAELRREPGRLFLEIGPGPTLSSLVLQHPASRCSEGDEAVVVPALRHSYETQPDVAYALTALGKLWLAGGRVDWGGFYAHERRRRVVLPTYPFERQRYLIDTEDATREHRRQDAPADGVPRLYFPSWRRAPAPASGLPDGGSWLLFADKQGMGEALARRLRAAGRSVTVARAGAAGEALSGLGDGTWRLDPRSPEAHATLLAALPEPPGRIVHLWSLGAPAQRALALGFESLLALAAALVSQGVTAPTRLYVVGDHFHEVSGEEELALERSAVLGAVKAIPRELPQISCLAVDVSLPASGRDREERLLDQLLAELGAGGQDRLVAWRGNHRWVATAEPLALPAATPERAEPGAWLILNGLDEAAPPFAEHLARTTAARLVLVEPQAFPAREEWDEWHGDGAVGGRIRRVLALENAGAEVLVAAADPTAREELSALLARARERFGPLRGVVHVLEAGGNGGLAHMAAGLRAVDALLRDGEVQAALVVTVEGPRAEAAAAGFLADAFAAASGGRWTSVVWGVRGGDEAAGAAEAVRRLLAAVPAPGAPQVVVVPAPLAGSWSRLEAFPESAAAPPPAVGYYPRPSLRVEYVAPRTDTEAAIARSWQELLGIEQVGIHDSFLELGGDSLLATRLAARLRDALRLDLPVRLFFEKPTVAQLAEGVEEMRRQREDLEAAELLEKIRNLSEEELEMEILRIESVAGQGEPAHG